jgi:hypothetical protein
MTVSITTETRRHGEEKKKRELPGLDRGSMIESGDVFAEIHSTPSIAAGLFSARG